MSETSSVTMVQRHRVRVRLSPHQVIDKWLDMLYGRITAMGKDDSYRSEADTLAQHLATVMVPCGLYDVVQRCVMGELSEAAFVDADKVRCPSMRLFIRSSLPCDRCIACLQRLLERAVAVGVLFERTAAATGMEKVAPLFPHVSAPYMKQVSP